MDGDTRMSNYQFSNNANTTIGSTLSSSATTITVATGTGVKFPILSGSQFFTGTIFAAGSSTGTPNEIVYVTARTGDTMTVLRGQEGTTAQSWPIGAIFSNFLTAGALSGLSGSTDIQSQFGNSAVDSGSANAGIITLSPAITSLSSILYSPIRVKKVGSINTAAYTLNVNGFGAKNVVLNGDAIQAGQLEASQIYEVVWDGTSFELMNFPAVLPTGSVTSTTIATNAVLNSNLAQMGANTVKANLTGSFGNASDVSVSSLLSGLGFGSYSLVSPGYYHLPNGLIIQWGTSTQAAYSSGLYTTTFPISFTTVSTVVISGVTEPGNYGGQNNSPMTYSTGTGSFSWQVNSSCSGAFWVAIGY